MRAQPIAVAGADDVLVEDVIDALRRIAPVEVSALDGIEENVRFRLPLELEENVNARANHDDVDKGMHRTTFPLALTESGSARYFSYNSSMKAMLAP
jgi:hypothetical protein